MTRCTLALMALLAGTAAHAQTIYRCTDASGGTLISNTRVDKNCKPIVTGDAPVPAPAGAKPKSGAAANPTPAGFPRVAEDTQKARDNDRRHILEQELAAEQRNRDQAKKELAEQESVLAASPERNSPKMQERLQPYRERIAQHERNIQAIQKEMGGLK